MTFSSPPAQEHWGQTFSLASTYKEWPGGSSDPD